MKTKALILIFTMTLFAAKVAGQCVNAGSDESICKDATSSNTGASAPADAVTLLWTSGSGGSFSAATSASSTWTPPIGFTGTATLTLTYTGGACAGPFFDTKVVTVNPTSIGGSVTGGTTICSGSTSGVLTLGSYTGSIVRWESSPNGINSWSTISNTADTYTSGSLTATTYFRAVVQSGVCSEENSTSATVTVDPILTAGVSIGASQNPACAGSAVTFTAIPTNGGSTPAYQWKVNNVNAGTNSNSFTYTPVSGDVVNVVMTSNASPCLTGNPATSSDITMTVNALPVPTLSSNAIGNKICAGGSVTFTAGGAGAGTYQFFKNGVSQGAPGTTNTYTTTTLTDGQVVTVTIVDGNNCTDTHSGIGTTVYAYPSITAMSESGASGEPYSIVPVDGTNGTVPSGTTYSWVTGTPFSSDLTIVSGASGTDQTSISGTITNSKSTSKKGNFTVTPKNVQCIGSDFNLEMTISPKAFISDKTTSICNGGTFTVSPVDGDGSDIVPAGTTYSWELPVAPGITGLASGPSGSVNISGTLTNSTTSPINVVYSVKPKSGTVTGANFNVTVTVRPTAVVNQPANQVKCNGAASNAVTFSGVANSYTWTNSNTGIGLGASGSGDISSFTATNAGITPVTATITVTPYYDGCPGSTKNFTITVNPLPTLGSVSQNDQICSGATAIIDLTGLLTGTTSTIGYKIGADVQSPVSGVLATGTSASFSIPNISAVNNGKTLQITSIQNQGTGCSATFTNSTILIVNSATTPTISVVSGNDPPCINSTVVYSTESGMTGYTWTVPSGGTITGGAGTNALSVLWNSAGPHTVTVNYTNSNGCTASSPATRNINVIALPVPTITGPASACINSTGNVYVTQPGMATYTWAITGGIITSGSTAPGSNQAIVTWTSAGGGTISVTCTNSAGCAASSPFILGVTVNPLPVPSFITAPSVVRVTSSGNVYSTETGMSNYVWNVSGGGAITSGGTPTSSSATVTWNTTGPQTVSVSYTNTSSCTAAAPTVQNVTVNPIPSVSNVQISGTPAIGNTLTGSYNYTDGGGGSSVSTLRWLKNGVTPVGGTTNTYIVQPSDLNNTITFEVTPVSTVGLPNTGIAVKSSPTVPVEDLSEIPVADQICIEGVRSAGSLIKAKYRYNHSKPEGASILKWYIDGVYTATGSSYTLLAADIDNNEDITFEVTPVSSNIVPVSGTAVVSNPLAKMPLLPVDYSVSVTSVPLSATPSGGIFSGPGVTNGNFSPKSVGIGGPYNINYQLIIVNSATTCSQQVTKAVIVVESTTEFNNFKAVYCNDETPSVITITGVPPGSTSLGFTCTDGDAIVSSTAFTVTIDPRKMNQGSNVDHLYFSFRDILSNTYTISKPFVIDKVGTNIQILNLDPEYCIDAPISTITVTGATPAGGFATWTGEVLLDLTATTATVKASKGIPGQTYPLSYQYTTPLGCKSAKLLDTVTINPLPNTEFTLNPFYNLDGPVVDLIPVQSPGTFSGNGVNSNNKLLPLEAGTGEHTIYYYIKDTNGCDSTGNHKTTIKKAQGTIKLSNGDPFPKYICYRDTTFIVNVTGLPDKSTVTSFVNSKNSIIHTPGTTSASYNVPAAGEGKDTITLSYKLDAVDYWITTVVEIDSLGLVDFINFPDKICDNIAPKKLNATPTGGLFFGPVDGYFLVTDTTAGSYTVKYVYTNQKTKCKISKTIPVEIIKAPVVSFTPRDVCIESFNDITYFTNKTRSDDKVNSWLWTFAEIGAIPDTAREARFLYKTGGIHSLKLTVTTEGGCLVTKDSTIDLGRRPNGNFTWKNDCYSSGNNLLLTDATVTDLTITSQTWDFNNGSYTSTERNPVYPMPGTGIMKVKYIVRTNYANCADTVVKNIYLRPTFKLAPDVYYTENFENGVNGWGKDESDPVSSWKFGIPDGKVIKSASSGANAWFTKYDTLKQKIESSSVISPCFDFTDIQRPMISLKAIKRFEKNRNGAAIQYFVEGDSLWHYVGTQDDGIEWYNSTLINGKPGGEKIGWTTLNEKGDANYVESRHALDELRGEKNVKFRIAFGSDGTSAVGEGIAFDDILIGERSRKVLLEHFTNAKSKPSSEATRFVDKILTSRVNDVINIQYHTNFPGTDKFYVSNQGDASARIFSYGLSRVPYSMIDGGNQLMYASLADYKSFQTDLDTNDLSRRSLLDARFTISVEGTEALPGRVLTITSKITSLSAGSYDNLMLYLVVTEKKNNSLETGALGEKTFYNVFRKFVPDAGGLELKKSWAKGESVVIPDQTWAIPGNLAKSDIEVIAFIQNSQTKEVYQISSELLTTAKTGINVLPSEANAGYEDLPKETATSFGLYPNPADERLTIEFNNRLAEDAEIRIFDLQGAIKSTYKVASGESGLFIEDLSLKVGIYFVRVTLGGVDLGFKKLIVTGN